MTATSQAKSRKATNCSTLCDALTKLETVAEAKNFLADLCTPAEVKALSERWHVAQLLDETDLSYREIHAETSVSTTTIASRRGSLGY